MISEFQFPPEYFDIRLLLGALAVFAAGLIRGFSGFGSALINAPVLSLIWGPTIGVPVAALVEIAPAVQLTPKAIKIAHWKTVWAFSIPALILLPAGTFILVSVPADDMRRAIGAIVLVVALILWSGWRYRGPRGTIPSMCVGLVGGSLAGATGVAAWRGRREHRPCDDASKYLRERRTAERGPRAPVRLAHAPH